MIVFDVALVSLWEDRIISRLFIETFVLINSCRLLIKLAKNLI